MRIGNAFLNAGIGYGGSCFPKDTKALMAIGEQEDTAMQLLKSTVAVNQNQREILVDKILYKYGSVEGKRIALLGLAFKPNTDDMREAPSIIVSRKLLEKGALVQAYDPVAVENAKKILPDNIKYTTSIQETITGADITIILTEWKEIKEYPLRHYQKHMNEPVIFDGRNCFTLDDVRASGVEYHSIGRSTVLGV